MVKFILFILFLNPLFNLAFAQKTEVKDYIIAGNQNYHSGDFAKAEADYKSALTQDGQSIKANYNLGNSLYEQKRYDEAVVHFEKVTQSKSASKQEKFQAFHNIGKTYLDANKPEEAVENFKKALKLNPYDDETRYNYALAKKLLEKQQKDQENQNNNENQNKQGQKDNKEDSKNQQNQNEKEQSQQQKDQQQKDENQGNQQDGGQNGNDKGKDDNSPQQITKGSDGKNQNPQNGISKEYQAGLLEALENQEQETLKKIISQKAQKVRTNTEKDW